MYQTWVKKGDTPNDVNILSGPSVTRQRRADPLVVVP